MIAATVLPLVAADGDPARAVALYRSNSKLSARRCSAKKMKNRKRA